MAESMEQLVRHASDRVSAALGAVIARDYAAAEVEMRQALSWASKAHARLRLLGELEEEARHIASVDRTLAREREPGAVPGQMSIRDELERVAAKAAAAREAQDAEEAKPRKRAPRKKS